MGRSEYCNDFKVAVHGRDVAISKIVEKLASYRGLRRLSGLRLVHHCRLSQAQRSTENPSSSVLNYMSRWPIFMKSQTTVSIHPVVLKQLQLQYCFADWKYCFYNTPTLTGSRRTQHRNTPFTTKARVVRQTHSGFLLVGQVPLYSCAIESVTFVCALAQTDW